MPFAKFAPFALVALLVGVLVPARADGQILNPKRGFADVRANYANLQAVNAGWYYTWGTGSASPGNFGAKHYPMFWSSPSDATIASVKARPGLEWVLGFNEPERTDQANMSVTSALDAWSRICTAFDGTTVKLASPAVSDNTAGRAWIADFMTQLEDRRTNTANPKYNPALRVDAIAFHWYGYSNPNNPTEAANWFIGSVDYYRNTYGKAVMPTEFAIHDWGGAYTDQQIIDANKLFLDNVLPRLDSRTYVPGYAWYHWFSDSPLYAGSPATPTPMGYRYVGAIASGSTANLGGQSLGEYVAYLTGGTLTMTGTAPGDVKYISALANTSSLTGGRDWGLTGTSTWLRVEPDAVLRKTGTNDFTLNGSRITNNGTIDVSGGTLRLTNSATVTGAGSFRIGPSGTLAIEQAAGTFALDDPLDIAGGTLDATGNLRLTGSVTFSGQATLVGTATTTLAGPLVSGSVVGGFTKAGPGSTVVTSTATTYAGATRIEGGLLSVTGRLYAGSVGAESAVTVASGTLLVGNLTDLPAGSLGNLPPTAERLTLDGGGLRIAGSGSTGRGFTIGAGGGVVEVQPGVNVTFFESTPAARIESLGGDLTLHATTGSGTLAKAYEGTGGLVKTGSGTWTLAGDNSYAGTTRVVAGTLRIAGTTSLAGSTLDMNAADTGAVVLAAATASTFDLGGLSGSRGLAIGIHSLRIGANGSSTTYAGGISGAGGIEKTGSGTLSLGGSNAFGGDVTVAAGMLRFTQAAALPGSATLRIGADGTLALPAGSPLGAWIAAGRIDATSAGAIAVSGSLGGAIDLRGVPRLAIGGSGSATLSGPIVPAATGIRLGGGDGTLTVTADLATRSLVKIGADTLILTGSNSFPDGIELRGGLVQPATAAALGTSGTISFFGGGLRASAGDATDYSPRFSQAPGQHVRIDTAGRAVAFTQPLSSVGGSLTKLGDGTLALAATNALDGTVRIAGGTLAIGGTTALAAATLDLATGDSGTLAFTAPTPRTYSFAGLAGSRSLANAGHTLEIGGTGRTSSYAGVISGSGGLVKVGGGTLTLAGDTTYTGTTTVVAGVLRIGAGGTTGGVRGPIVNQASVVFDRSGTSSHTASISGSGGVVKTGGGTVILAGTSSFTGGIRVEAGTLQVGGVVSEAGRLTMAGGTFAFARPGGSQGVAGVMAEAGESAISNTVASGTLALGAMVREAGGVIRFPTRTGPITTSATTANGIVAAWAFTGTGTGTRYATVAGGTIAAFTSGTVLTGTGAFGGMASGDTGTVNYDITSSGTFAAMGLARVVNTIDYSGAGAIQPAANAVTFTTNGILTTGGGPLVIGGTPRMDIVAGASRELVVNTVTADVVLNNGVFNHASGASGLTKAGTATLVINGSSGYTGRTTVANGTLRFGSGGSGLVVPSSQFVVRGTLAFNHADAVTLPGGLAGDGTVVKDGGGTLTLTGTGGFTGRIAVAGGTLAVGGGGVLGPGGVFAGGLDIAAGAVYVHRSTVSQTLAAPVSGDGGLVVAGGRLVLAAANTFTGDVTIGSGGSLVLAHPAALGGQPAGGGIVLGSSTSAVVELAAAGGGPFLRGDDGFRTSLVVGAVAGSTEAAARRALAAGSTFGAGTLTVSASPGLPAAAAAELVVPALALASGSAGGVTRLAATTARVTLGGAAIVGSSLPMTLELSGTGAGSRIEGPLADGAAVLGLTKSGSGEWTLAAPSTFTGPTLVTGGTLRLLDGAALVTSGSVAIAGGCVVLPADVPLAVGLRGLSINEAAGLLDIGRGQVTVASGMTAAAILADLAAGRGSGAWDGATGIVSSAVVADAQAGVARTIGWLDNGAGSFTVGYAAAGDTNLDGVIDLLDAANFLAAGLFDTGASATWSAGDFTSDGIIDIVDVADFVSTGLYDAGGYAARVAAAAPPVAVPEPAAWPLVAAACGAGLIATALSRVARRTVRR